MIHTASRYELTDNSPPAGWFKSSYSASNSSCVEVRFDGGLVSIRDSKYRRNPTNDPAHEPIITVTAGQWTVLLNELTGHSPVGANGALIVETAPDGAVILRAADAGTTLHYTHSEWQMYLAGVRDGEFDHPDLAVSAS